MRQWSAAIVSSETIGIRLQTAAPWYFDQCHTRVVSPAPATPGPLEFSNYDIDVQSLTLTIIHWSAKIWALRMMAWELAPCWCWGWVSGWIWINSCDMAGRGVDAHISAATLPLCSNNIRPLNGDAADTNTGHCHRGRWGTGSSYHHTVQQYHRQIKYLCAQRIYQVYMMIMFHWVW